MFVSSTVNSKILDVSYFAFMLSNLIILNGKHKIKLFISGGIPFNSGNKV